MATTSLTTLPAEILIMIMKDIPVIDMAPLLCVLYPTLLTRGLIPQSITCKEIKQMERAIMRVTLGGNMAVTRATGLGNLPVELRLGVGRYMNLQDTINFVIASWPCFYGT